MGAYVGGTNGSTGQNVETGAWRQREMQGPSHSGCRCCRENEPRLEDVLAEVFPTWREVQREWVSLSEVVHENRRTILQRLADDAMRGTRPRR